MVSLFFKLIRWPNLVIIFLTQLLFLVCIVQPLGRFEQLAGSPGGSVYILIAIAYMLLAAGGYIINDYFDLDIDLVNKPGKIFITNGISHASALGIYVVMNIATLGAGFWICKQLGNWTILYCIAICMFLLYCYSAYFKKQFLIGNIVVAAISSSAIPVLTLIEAGSTNMPAYTRVNLWRITLLYTFFAFIISFARELVKDIEDADGDRQYQARTIPIVLGSNAAKFIVIGCLSCLVLTLVSLQPALWGRKSSAIALSLYSIGLVILPLVLVTREVFLASMIQDYRKLSKWMKLVMVTGILSMVFIRYIFV